MKTVIAIDVGTTYIKSMLFREDGVVLSAEKAETPLEKTEDGSVYRPYAIWNIVRKQLLFLSEKAQGTCAGISITGMAEAGLAVNKESGMEESDIIPWFDRRTTVLAGQMSADEDDKNFAKTGLRNSFKYGIYKFLWLLEHKKVDKKQAVWMSMCDYILYKLTGQFVTDPSFAARTYVYDIVNGYWDIERIQGYGLEEDNFPEIIGSGEIAGIWKEKGIPVAIAGHDHICAAFGLLMNHPESICNSAGTSETYIGRLRELDGKLKREDGLLYGPFVDGGWFFMANVPSSGHSVEWFRKKIQDAPFDYWRMNEQLLSLERGPTGILYYPYLTGMGSPYYDGDCEGALLGLKEEYDCYTVLKGIMEGIQYQAAWLLGICKEKHSAEAEYLICAGGSVNNKALMQLKADILGIPVRIPLIGEATLAGAAALLLKRQFGEKTLRQFSEKVFFEKECFEPDPGLHKQYKEIQECKFLPIIRLLRQEMPKKKSERENMTKVNNLTNILKHAAENGYAVGSFSARYTKLIRPIIQAAMNTNSPVIVQLSEKEIIRHKVSAEEFAKEFYKVVGELQPQVPLALHLDHTKTLETIQAAMDAGFTSVMMDASEKDFDDNVAITKQVVEMAHKRNVTVEAELGKIGTTDFAETDMDEEMYTVPEEAKEFCEQTGVDCLAVSVGTAHGVYTVKQPSIDFKRLEDINRLTATPLVLHGGSGVPSEMVVEAAELPTGGVSKVNIATDLELEMLAAVGRTGHLTEEELNAYPGDTIEKSREAVRLLVEDKITNYLRSNDRAK